MTPTEQATEAFRAAFLSTTFIGEGSDIAKKAMSDAEPFFSKSTWRDNPQVVFSDDGLLTVEWCEGDHGLVFLFAGDKSVQIAFRTPERGYAENSLTVPINHAE